MVCQYYFCMELLAASVYPEKFHMCKRSDACVVLITRIFYNLYMGYFVRRPYKSEPLMTFHSC